jgi:hypothetical protein
VGAIAADAELRIEMRPPLPGRLAVGRGSVLFVAGSCSHPAGIESVEIDAGGSRTRADLQPTGPARAAFWALAPVLPGATRLEVSAEARLGDGAAARQGLGEIELGPLEVPEHPAAVPAESDGELIAICMATYEPDPDLFERQIESIRAQSHGRWVCLISDDCSSSQSFERIQAAVDGDARFATSRSERRLGIYWNFERALAMAPADAAFVALADQDDHWYSEKLAALRATIGSAQLAFSDARLVDAAGKVLADTFWTRRRNHYDDLGSLLLSNTVTGAASLFRRELLDVALPFPSPPGVQFHDHWIALAALAGGEIAYVDRPLYDYLQHRGAALGHPGEGAPASARLPGEGRLDSWRRFYFDDVCRLRLLAEVLELRCGDRLTPGKRRALQPRGIASLAARRARSALGRERTGGEEGRVLRGIAWRRLARARRRPG